MSKRKFKLDAKNKVAACFSAAVALVLILAVVLITILSGRGDVTKSGELLKSVNDDRKSGSKVDAEFKKQYSDFCLSVIGKCAESDENTAFSLTNAMSAAALMAYGADGVTESQIEKVIGGDGLQTAKALSGIEKRIFAKSSKSGVRFSNTVWLNSSALYGIKKTFLRADKKYFGLGVVRESFAESQTFDSAVRAVTDATSGNTMPAIDFQQTQYMNIVSGASFVSKWKEQADEKATFSNLFTGAKEQTEGTFFRTLEKGYITGENFVGITKEYNDDFTFVGLLPKNKTDDETSTVADIVAELRETGNFSKLLTVAKDSAVSVTLPYYIDSVNTPTTTNLSKIFKQLGAEDIFTKSAELKNMANNSRNLHLDSFTASGDISITPAGSCSATSEGKAVSEDKLSQSKNSVIFDRSFIYFVVDNETELPVYFAILNNI